MGYVSSLALYLSHLLLLLFPSPFKHTRSTMESQNPDRTPMYPQVIQSNPDNPSSLPHSNPTKSPSSSSLYPKIDMSDRIDNLFPDPTPSSPAAPSLPVEEILLTVPGAILNLIDEHYSVELACGDLSIVSLRQGDNVLAVLARISDDIQWPLAKDEASVKLDESHYFFSFRAPKDHHGSDSDSDDEKSQKSVSDSDNLLNYGLTIASKGQEGLLRELDKILDCYSSFSIQKVSEKVEKSEVLDGTVAMARDISPADLKSEMREERCAAYWTTLAPNVEDYSGTVAKMIASGSGKMIKGILWCGDVTVDRLKWGNEVMMKRVKPGAKLEISPETMKRIKRVKRVTKMTEKVVTAVLSGVVKVSGFFTSSVANSKVGKKFFGLLPGEIVLATLDGFSKVCDAIEVAGKNVLSTSSTVTTGLVSQKYGEEAAKATSEGLDAAGYAFGTALAVFRLRKALNPKSVLKPTTLATFAVKTAAVAAKSS